ncbi:hypothetical protein BCV70DRAFT_198588 [Testicularia cyperi]|uniref:Uncharacterized protein n=1 Tax=Testicularia cyperi TaxID=1882483 RepID=A0A317XVI0_9BASI|nr:hypothetical protein BCV70DRAFT_198588 [Testicularia cyperi]
MKVGDESAFWTWTPDSSEFCTYFTGKHCKVDMDANDLVCPKMTDDEVKQFKSDVATRYHHLRYHFWHDGEFQPEFVAW